ncbi:60S ribosomal protein L20B [Gurleya vavrai]
MSIQTLFKEYKIFASEIPSQKNPQPQIFTSSIFAKNEVSARSKMSHILEKKHKIKSKNSVFLKIEIIENENKSFKIKNYGISYVYRSKNGLHNMYKEFRGLTRCDVVDMLFQNMAGKHKASENDIKIVSVDELENENLKRLNVIQFTKEDINFPIFKKSLAIEKVFVNENEKYFA